MSYRSFKRVLGETSLERKCRFLFGACLLLLISSSFLLFGRQTEKLVYDKARDKGQLLVESILAMTHWYKLETTDKFKPLIAEMSKQIRNEKYEWRGIRPEVNNPRDDQRPRDKFERDVLARFVASGAKRKTDEKWPAEFEERRLDDTKEYQYYKPIYASTSCLACHESFVYHRDRMQAGDLMAVLAVQFSDEETQDALTMNRAVLAATAIVTVFLAMIALYVVVRYIIVKPLGHLRDLADEVGRGNLELRAEIHTNDEFEEVAAAFNRMLRHVLTAQQDLRLLNNNLDGKVDQLAQANMQLHEMNRLKSDFLATMSHELRTPLNSIIGFSDVLAGIEQLDDRQRRYVKNIQKSGRMLLDMINDILDLAKIESGRMEVRLVDFRLASVVAAQCDMARPLAERKNIDLEVNLADGLSDLRQDQGKVQQILNNLLSNAIKFTPEGGRIVVSAGPAEPDHVLVEVSDTGVGIAPEDQVAIFEKFRQGTTVLSGGDAMTREYSGTGLGLSIVKEMCKLLGGEISLVSELGKGSTFTVRLPRTLASRPLLVSPLAEELEELTNKPRALGYQPSSSDAAETVGSAALGR
jgi:signal transduction histidine kinase